MTITNKLLFLSLLFVTKFAYCSPEVEVQKKLNANYPDVSFTAVRATPLPTVFEVQIGKKIVYTDSSGKYFFPTMVEMKTKRDFGKEKEEDLARIDFKSLPLADAIKTVKGSGARSLAVFSDPHCPYCLKLENTLANVTDVTIYTFLMPLDQLHPEARAISVSTWCAKDRAEAWATLMNSKVPPATASCSNPIERNLALAKKLNIYGTPALIFADGRVIPGAMDLATLENYLSKVR
jgi:thiol:disulfide interchange protein DsbC